MNRIITDLKRKACPFHRSSNYPKRNAFCAARAVHDMLIAPSPILTTHERNSACRRLTEALGGTNSSPFGQQMRNSATQGIYPWTLISSLSPCHAKPSREGIHFLTAGCRHTQPHCCCPPLIAGPSMANLWQSPRGGKIHVCLHWSAEIRPLWKDFFIFFFLPR